VSPLHGEPGLALFVGALVLMAVAVLALALGWGLVLLLVAFLQVVVARTWSRYLEVPGGVAVALGVLVVAAAADVGVVVAHLVDGSDSLAGELLPLAPAFGVVFLVAVLVQLLRRDGRPGVLAGLVAGTTGGLLVVGLAMWLPLLGSAAGASAVAAGFGVVALVGVVLGANAWVRQAAAPSGALLLPVLLALLAGPAYVVGRIVAG